MQSFVAVVVFLLGAATGSFLSVLVRRLRTRESWMLSRSYCPHCKTVLGWRDLVPLLSFLLLRGRCRQCREGISWLYPAIEVVVGVLFVLAYLVRSQEIVTGSAGMAMMLLLRDWLAIAVLVAVFVFDFLYSLIPRALVLPTALIVLFFGAMGGDSLSSLVLGAVVAGGFFGVQYAVSKGRWIGMGDVTLGIFLGATLGFSRMLVALLVAYVTGAAYAGVMLAAKKYRMKSEIPFGTFLAVGSVVSLLCGHGIIRWYLSLL